MHKTGSQLQQEAYEARTHAQVQITKLARKLLAGPMPEEDLKELAAWLAAEEKARVELFNLMHAEGKAA